MIRKLNRDTAEVLNHEELIARAKSLASDARGGFQGAGIAPLVLTAYPGAEIRRAEMLTSHADEAEMYTLALRIIWEGELWVLRGRGNTVLSATMSCITNGALVQDDDFDEHLLSLLEKENPD